MIFEHKIRSPLGPDQLDKYRRAGEALWSGRNIVVLITASAQQHEQNPDVALTWAQIYRVAATWRDGGNQDAELVEDFLGLLADEGLGPPAPISHEAILSYLPAKTLEASLLAVVREVAKADWSWLYDRLGWPGQARQPYIRGSKGIRDGRQGVELLPGWRPALFVGVLLDGTDHGVRPSAPHKGPDFCLVLGFHREDGFPPRDSYLGSREFQALRTRLAEDSGRWDYVDMFDKHRWHPLHLRKPMLEVFRGTMKFEEQVKRFIEHGRDAIAVLLGGGELEDLRERFMAEREGRA